MRAALLDEGSRALRLAAVPDPRPGPGDVLVRVRAAGLCGTDLGFIEGLKVPPGVRFPVLLGHEIAGEVAAAGPGAAPWRPGDRVVVNPYLSCGGCHACRAGRPSICVAAGSIGLHRPGGFADLAAVPAANLHRLPDHVPFPLGAILPDAVATAHHALVRRGGLAAGQSVAIFGAGGVGTHGILLAKLLGAAPLIAVVRREAAAARARALGADAVVAAEEPNPAREIRRLTGGLGVDLAVDFVGKPETVRACAAGARIGGRAVIVGVSDAQLSLMASSHLVRYELDVRGAFGAGPDEIEAALALAADGRLDLSRSVSRLYPLEAISDAVEALRRRAEDIVRLVIIPAGAAAA